jgi:crotonobetainyl-CoA:carnitine CoA-transferase CaiB-like acyl-CoA transferase
MTDNEYPLSGIRVIDLGRMVSGPVCSFYLASLGAEVIRIDQPGGDVSWQVPPFVGPNGVTDTRTSDRDVSINHLKRDRGKRNVSIDIQSEAGRDLLRDLARTSDALVENFRPGVMSKWGIGYENLSAINPGLVYCAVSGYGQSGPDVYQQGMDMIIQGVSGMMARNGGADSPPTKIGFTACDLIPAVWGALGVVCALRQRERTGKGQLVDVAMYDVALSIMWDEPMDLYADKGLPERTGNKEPRGAPVNVYETIDGWVTVVVTSENQFLRLGELIGRPELGREMPTIRDRVAGSELIDQLLSDWMSDKTTDKVVELLHSINVPSGAVNSMDAARRSAQAQARQMLLPLRHPDMAPGESSALLGPQMPLAFDGRAPLAPAEPLGSSTDEVLSSLGRTPEEIAELRRSGIVA